MSKSYPRCERSDSTKAHVAVIGDFDSSFKPHVATNEALAHTAIALGLELKTTWIPSADLEASTGSIQLSSYDGLWIAPGSPYKSLQGALSAIQFARESGIPLLATCGGFQHLVLEYARNVLGFSDAQHPDYDPCASRLFISRLSCSLVGRSLVITLRPESLVARLYGQTRVTEQYYCNCGMNPEYVQALSSGSLRVAGSDTEREVRVLEMPEHPFYVGTLFRNRSVAFGEKVIGGKLGQGLAAGGGR